MAAVNRRGGWLLAAVCLGPFVTQLSTFALSPFLPFIAEDIGASVSLLGQIPAVSMLIAASLGLVIGPLADRFGYRLVLVAGVLASGASALAIAASPSVLILAPVALVGAVGRSIGLPVSQAYVASRFAGAAVRRGLSLIQSTGTLAPILGIPLVTGIAAVTGWRGAFVALGVLALGAVVVILALLPAGPGGGTDTRRPRAIAGRGLSLAAFRPLFQDGPTLWLFASSIARNTGVWALTTYLGAFLVDRHGLGGVEVGWVFTATGVGNLIGSVATGGPLGRLPLRGVAIAGPTIMAFGLGGLALLPLPTALVVVMLAIGFIGNGMSVVSHNVLLVGGSPGGHATTTSLNQTCMSLGGAVGSSLGGLLIATGGYPALGALTLSCNLAAALFLFPACRERPAATSS